MNQFSNVWSLLNSRERNLVAISLLVRLGLVILDLAGIFLVGVVVSLLSGTKLASTSPLFKFLAWLNSLSISNGYAIIAVIAVAFFILKGIFSVAVNRVTSAYVASLEARKASDLFSLLLNGRLDTVEKFGTQEIVHGLNLGMTSAVSQVINVGSSIFSEIVLLVSISAYLAYTNIYLFLMVAVFFAAVGLGMHLLIGKAAGHSANKSHQATLKSSGIVSQVLDSFRQISILGRKDFFVSNFNRFRREAAIQGAVYGTITTLPRYITEIAVMVGAGILVLQRSGTGIGGASAPVIAVFLAGLFRIVSSMLPLQSGLTSLKRYAREAALANEMISAFTIEGDKPANEAPPALELELTGAPKVELKRASFSFPNSNRKIIENLSLVIEPGDYVAVIGKSGLGKSTFADLLLGLRSPTSGEVFIGGMSPNSYLQLKNGICGFVPQQIAIFDGSVLENITFERDENTVNQDALAQAISMACLDALIEEMPQGLQTNLGTAGRKLSGGQIQRIGLARALYTKPKLLVLDEVTSALDPETEEVIDAALETLKGQVTCIVIAHKPGTISKANRVIKFTERRVEITGSVEK